jgi:hypothetical protein
MAGLLTNPAKMKETMLGAIRSIDYVRWYAKPIYASEGGADGGALTGRFA